MFISPTTASDYSERFQDMYTFSELIWNIIKVGKIDNRKMQGQSTFRPYNACKRLKNVNFLYHLAIQSNFRTSKQLVISYFTMIHYKSTQFDSSEWSRNTTLMQLPFAAHYSAQRAICMIMIRHLPVFNGILGANLRSLPFYRKHCLLDPGSTGCLPINT